MSRAHSSVHCHFCFSSIGRDYSRIIPLERQSFQSTHLLILFQCIDLHGCYTALVATYKCHSLEQSYRYELDRTSSIRTLLIIILCKIIMPYAYFFLSFLELIRLPLNIYDHRNNSVLKGTSQTILSYYE